MGINIKNEEAQKLIRELSGLTGESMTDAVKHAVQEQLRREKAKRGREGVAERLMEIGRRCASRPVRDDRTPDEIIGYDEHGLPT